VRPRLLDLFCGEGGAAQGYYDAGFDVFGVDTDPRRLKKYPFECVEADALEFLLAWGWEFPVKHASPPCTGYTRGTAAIPDRLERYERLIAVTRAALRETGGWYVLENVEDAKSELENPVLLCGRMFDLSATDTDGTSLVMDRHRLFESNAAVMTPPHLPHDRRVQVAGAYGGARRDKTEAREVRKGGYVPKDLDVLRSLLRTPWMTEKGCFLSIPPVYTEFLGEQILAQVEAAA